MTPGGDKAGSAVVGANLRFKMADMVMLQMGKFGEIVEMMQVVIAIDKNDSPDTEPDRRSP